MYNMLHKILVTSLATLLIMAAYLFKVIVRGWVSLYIAMYILVSMYLEPSKLTVSNIVVFHLFTIKGLLLYLYTYDKVRIDVDFVKEEE